MLSKVILSILFVRPRLKCSLNKGHIANVLFKGRNTVLVVIRGFRISVFLKYTKKSELIKYL